MAADHIKLLFICLSFILSFIFIKLAQADNYIIHMDHSAMPKVFASRQSWYMSTLSSLSGNTNAKIPAAEPIYSYNHVIQVDRTLGASLRLGTDVFVNGEVLYPGNFSSSQFPIVFMGACDDIDELKKVAGNIVVCQDPGSETSLFLQHYHIVVARNVAGVFITNYTHLDTSIESSYPAIYLGQKDGDIVLDYIKTNKTPKASIEFKRTSLGFKPSPIKGAGISSTAVIVGEVEEAMEGLVGVDFLVVDSKRKEFARVLRHAKLSHEGAILACMNGLDIAHIGAEAGVVGSKKSCSRWIKHIDQQSGEEHVFQS
ncbi:hypothetical protein V6N11_052940 [Hibiscus sabdariffa]|uniref:Inhibitor I9 domain-containing protein n=1 Tax=Hibiscus sabdariffa TaxID=183260 RepID=A0ABR2UBL5_9ROSI